MSLPLHAFNFLCHYGWLSRQPKQVQLALCDVGEIIELPANQILDASFGLDQSITALVSGATNMIVAPEFVEPFLMNIELPGSWRGEAGYIRKNSDLVAIQARVPSQIAVFSKQKLAQLSKEVPELRVGLMQLFSGHHELALNIIAIHGERDTYSRVQLTLLRLIGEGLMSGWGKLEDPIDLPINQSDLAEMCLVSRNSVGPVLSKLEKLKAIEIQYRNIRILNRELLRPRSFAQEEFPHQYAV